MPEARLHSSRGRKRTRLSASDSVSGSSAGPDGRRRSGWGGRLQAIGSSRLLQSLVLVGIAFTMLGAGTPSTRFDQLGHNLVCQCGCTQILLECNHVGCPVSPVMIDELHRQVATGLPDAGVLNWFAAKYGAIVLAAPIRGGFDTVAWVVPFAVLGLGFLAVFVMLRLWRRRYASLAAAMPPPASAESKALRERIRNETSYGG